MKPLELPLDQMTAREKLRAIETIWDDLARNERQVKSPDWHFDELKHASSGARLAKKKRSIGRTQRRNCAAAILDALTLLRHSPIL